LAFNYTLERQTASDAVCVTAIFGATFLRHQFGLGLNWSLRPSEAR
jgi:hypothetical protein